MKYIIFILSILLLSSCVVAKRRIVFNKFPLPNSLSESSGAIFFNNKLIIHNDSGGGNKLYELDTISGNITRSVTISNAINIDWEDMTQDSTSIYVGDIGNNVSGNRKDLKIYKINKREYLNNVSVSADVISYSYADQTDYKPQASNKTIWDAEALVSFNGEYLIVFTKNWVDKVTKGYMIPKKPGSYSVLPLQNTLKARGLVTGGTFNNQTKKLYLVGYTRFLKPLVWESSGFINNDVFAGKTKRTKLASIHFEQTEGITHVDSNRYFILSETFYKSVISSQARVVAFSTKDSIR